MVIFLMIHMYFRIDDKDEMPRISIKSQGLDTLLCRVVVSDGQVNERHKDSEVSTSLFVNQCTNVT